MANFKSMRFILAVLITASFSLTNFAHAGSIENARRLIELLDVGPTLESTIIGSVDQARNDLLGRGMPASTVNLVTATLKAEMLSAMPELIDEITGIYAAEFSDSELSDLITFYESPTGRKYVKSQGNLNTKQTAALDNWLEGVRARTSARLTGASA